MLIYNYTANGEEKQICVELLDHPFVQKWQDYLIRTANRLPNILWQFNLHGMSRLDDLDPMPHLRELHTSFNFLQTTLNLDYSAEIATLEHLLAVPTDLTQQHLNTWHRHFTTVATEYYSGRMRIPESVDRDKMFYSFHALNQNVHDLEFMTYSKLSRRIPMGDKLQYSAYCADARSLDGSNALWLDGHAENFTDSFDPAVEEYHYDVWLNEDIQGKDHMKAWLDEDDLTQGDVWGNSFMTPNVLFDPEMTYAAVLDNPEFIADYRASGKPLNRWPLGRVVNQVDWASVNLSKINSIVLNGVTLWENK
jgi:prepilin-type processing-associated H-X9-DG protein